MDPRPLWSRLKGVVIVFAAAMALFLAWTIYAVIKGGIGLPQSQAAGVITPALQRFMSAGSVGAYAAQAAFCAAGLSVGLWFGRRALRRRLADRRGARL